MSSEHLNVRIVIENLEGGETYAQHFVMAIPARAPVAPPHRPISDFTLQELVHELQERIDDMKEDEDDGGWDY